MSKSQGATNNFFVGVSGEDDEIEPQHLLLDQSLQIDLIDLFERQAGEFLDDEMERIEFDPKAAYRLESHQIFVIRKLDLPEKYAHAVSKPHQTSDFNLSDGFVPRISTVFAGSTSGKNISRVLFQQFRSPQLLDQKLALFSRSGTFHRIQQNGISLAHELAAIHVDSNLFFRSLAIVSRFFDLADFQPVAKPEEIGEFLAHPLFAMDDVDATYRIIEGDGWLLRRVASIRSNQILERVSARNIANKAKGFPIKLEVKKVDGKDRVWLPPEKKALKQVVKFLNEEFFHGELSNDLYETNSLRRLPPKPA